jgi:hypothetical protein
MAAPRNSRTSKIRSRSITSTTAPPRLQEVIAAGPEEASHHYQRRELAVAHLLAGNAGEGTRVAARPAGKHFRVLLKDVGL